MKVYAPLSEPISVALVGEDSTALDVTHQYLKQLGYKVSVGVSSGADKFLRRVKHVNVFVFFSTNDLEATIDFWMKAKRLLPKSSSMVIAEKLSSFDRSLLDSYGIDSVFNHPISWDQLTTEIHNLSSMRLFEDLVF